MVCVCAPPEVVVLLVTAVYPDVASIRTLFPLFVPHAAFWFCILCVCAPALAVASEPLAWEWLGICAVVNATVEAPPVFSTVLKLLSDVLIPTGTRPLPQATHVPPK